MNFDEPFESHNPYQAMAIDEKAVDAATFFRAEPKYVKLVPGTVGRTAYAMFMQHKWRFVVIGFAQIFLFIPLIALLRLAAPLPYVTRTSVDFFVVTGMLFLIFVLLALYAIVVSIHVSLRILRKEKRPSGSIKHNLLRLFWASLHTVLFFAASGLLIAISLLPLIIILNISMYFHAATFFGGIFLLIALIGWMSAIAYCVSRMCYAAHFIVDRELNFLAAMQASWQHTRENHKALIAKSRTPFAGIAVLLLLIASAGLGIFVLFGYQYCKGAVAYSMMTGQCELLEQLPDEW